MTIVETQNQNQIVNNNNNNNSNNGFNANVLLSFLQQFEESYMTYAGEKFFDGRTFERMFQLINRSNLVSDFVLCNSLVLMSRLLIAEDLNEKQRNDEKNVSYPYDSSMSMLTVVPKREKYPVLLIGKGNIRLVFAVCLMLSNKIIEDNPYDNFTFSTLCNIPLATVNQFEILVLKSLRFNVRVDPVEAEELYVSLQSL